MGVVRHQQILRCDLRVQPQHRPRIDHVMIGNTVLLRYLVNDVLQVDHGVVRARGLRGHEWIVRISYALFSIISGQPSESGDHQHHNWLRWHSLHLLNIIAVILNESVLGEFGTQCVATTESHKDNMRHRIIQLLSSARCWIVYHVVLWFFLSIVPLLIK